MASKKRSADGVIKEYLLVAVSMAEVEVDDESFPEMCEFTAQVQVNGTKVGGRCSAASD